jgi:hypothetical protein
MPEFSITRAVPADPAPGPGDRGALLAAQNVDGGITPRSQTGGMAKRLKLFKMPREDRRSGVVLCSGHNIAVKPLAI